MQGRKQSNYKGRKERVIPYSVYDSLALHNFKTLLGDRTKTKTKRAAGVFVDLVRQKWQKEQNIFEQTPKTWQANTLEEYPTNVFRDTYCINLS